MSWATRSIAALVLSNVCLVLAVVFLLTRSSDGGQPNQTLAEAPFIPTPTPVIYLETRFPWQTPIVRPAPMYGPLPSVPPPGGDLKPPTEPPGGVTNKM